MLILAFLLLMIVPAYSQKTSAKLSTTPVPVFVAGEAGYAGFRIPTIIKAANGDLIVFAEARRHSLSDSGDIDLVMCRSNDNGATWGPITVVWDDGENTCGNPVPVVVGRKGKILLLATWNFGNDRERTICSERSVDTRRVFILRSTDHGRTWSASKEITNSVKAPNWQWYATGPCHAIVKQRAPHKGRLIVPANHSQLDSAGKVQAYSQLFYSDNRGRSWRLGAISQHDSNESTVAECSDGTLLLNMRRYRRGGKTARLYARSSDGGKTWSSQGDVEDLIGPRCQGSLLNLANNGRPTETLLFSNPHARGRRNISLSVSEDNGLTWHHLITIFKGRSAYSDLVQLGSKEVGVLYENGEKHAYQRISFVVVSVETKSR